MKAIHRRTLILSLTINIILLNFSCGQISKPWMKYLPTSTTGLIINHSYYSLSYSIRNKESEWAFYQLTCEQTKGSINRTNNFRPDPLVKNGSSQLIDYKGSGYNRGIWKELEDRVRIWVCEDSLLYVIDGPIFTKSDSNIGPNHVTVPSFFYKIVFYNNPTNYELIGFIFPNCPGAMGLKEYTYKVDDIEKLTGIDFFPYLLDSIENRIESQINLEFWHLNN